MGEVKRRVHWDNWASCVTMCKQKVKEALPSGQPEGSTQWPRQLSFLTIHSPPDHHHHVSQSQSTSLFRNTPGIDWMDMTQSATFTATLCCLTQCSMSVPFGQSQFLQVLYQPVIRKRVAEKLTIWMHSVFLQTLSLEALKAMAGTFLRTRRWGFCRYSAFLSGDWMTDGDY